MCISMAVSPREGEKFREHPWSFLVLGNESQSMLKAQPMTYEEWFPQIWWLINEQL